MGSRRGETYSKPLPKISARALCVMDCGWKSAGVRNAHMPLSVASLTKILAPRLR